MENRSWKNKPWFPYAVAACIAVTLYVCLSNIGAIWFGIKHFIGYFTPAILALVFAYLVNPLSNFYEKKVFKRVKKEKLRCFLGIFFALITVLLFVSFLLITLIPQLMESISTFAGNLDGYMRTVNEMLESWNLSRFGIDIHEFISSSENLLKIITKFISDNIDTIISTSANAGKQFIVIIISFLLSIYILAAKDRLRAGMTRLLRAALPEKRFEGLKAFLKRCHVILNRYIVYNLLDSLIVGGINALFMSILGLPYIGLVSFVIAVSNLIPTFGPIVGAVIGAFILFLVKPWYALAFLIFTVVLQTADAYYIKPKLLGDSLGVSGLWILIGVIVGGRMFGVVGILLAIPAVAILDFTYREYFLPWLEKRRQVRDKAKEKPAMQPEGKDKHAV